MSLKNPTKVLILSTIKNIKSNVEKSFNKLSLSSLAEINYLPFEGANVNYQEIMKQNSELIKKCDVALADPDQIVRVYQTFGGSVDSIKWIQSTWAGVNMLVFPDPKDPSKQHPFVNDFVLTRMGGTFGGAMVEYCIGAIINEERSFHQYKSQQAAHLWKPIMYRRLNKLTVGILGLGDIGKEIAKSFKNTFGITIWALKRDSKNGVSSEVDRVFSIEEMSEFLGGVDYVINTLPSTQDTYHLLSGSVLSNCDPSRNCKFINVGRGTIIDESSLIKALDSKWIGGAVLDVFEYEPLPKESALWDYPNVTITPHMSATSLPEEVADLFAENFQNYLQSSPLKYVVNTNRGY